jgi:hypothetical protein
MSEVKVNKISPRTNCGTTQLGDAGDTITVTGDLKSNSIKSASGSTITLGQSGDTIQLGCGATQTGFGRTGTVDWQTGSIKTSTFTATSGEGYFVNTTGGAVTVNLPAGVAGAIVGLKDYAGTWGSNAVTLNPNGSDKIGGDNASDPTLEVNGGSVLLVFVDSTQGWLTTQESVTESPSGVEAFIVATGGTITECGDCKIHTFTGPGTFTVSSLASCATKNIVSHVVVAGGGAGQGAEGGGGGGAGGYREVKNPVNPYTASPLDGYPSAPNRVTVTATAFPITVGAGGSYSGPNITAAPSGSNSVFSTITSAGGGGGKGFRLPSDPDAAGGSGGGGSGRRASGCIPNPGASGNTPPVSPPQGNDGGRANTPSPTCNNDGGGGGGGAGAVGTGTDYCTGQPGGAGVASSITGSPVTRAGGGGGGSQSGSAGSGGSGGGGAGASGPGGGTSTAGTTNTGGGGGGGGSNSVGPTINGGAGGSGIVIIRYKFQ